MTLSCRTWLTMITHTLHGVWGLFLILTGCGCVTSLIIMIIPLIERSLIDDGLLSGQFPVLCRLVVLYLGLQILINGLLITNDWLSILVGERVALQWQVHLRRAMFRQPDHIFRRWDPGAILSFSTNDIPQVRSIAIGLARLPSLAVSIAVSIIVAIRLIGHLALLLLPLFVVIAATAWVGWDQSVNG